MAVKSQRVNEKIKETVRECLSGVKIEKEKYYEIRTVIFVTSSGAFARVTNACMDAGAYMCSASEDMVMLWRGCGMKSKERGVNIRLVVKGEDLRDVATALVTEHPSVNPYIEINKINITPVTQREIDIQRRYVNSSKKERAKLAEKQIDEETT